MRPRTRPRAARAALEGIVVVLWQTQDYVNIAGTIRAMKNFGLSRLRLIQPVEWDPWRIEGIAHGTEDIVQRIEIHDSLLSALGDCSYVVGMTARSRRAKRAVARPRWRRRSCWRAAADVARGDGARWRCSSAARTRGSATRRWTCATAPASSPPAEHASLNLAQAVLVMAYELWMEAQGRTSPSARPAARGAARARGAAGEAVRGRGGGAVDRGLLQEPADGIGDAHPARVVRRADPDAREAGFLRAIAIEVRKFVRRRMGEAGGEPPEPGGTPRDE